MRSGWRYRVFAFAGVTVLTIFAVLAANLYPVQAGFTTYTPLFWRLNPVVLRGSDLLLAIALNTVFVLAVLVPLFKPRPRRVLDTFFLAQRRVFVAGCVLAALGYFNYTYRLPRTTLTITVGLLAVTVPSWFVWIRQRPQDEVTRAILVGDDAEQMLELIDSTDLPYIGYLAPAPIAQNLRHPLVADGGVGVTRLGGLSRTEDTLVNRDIDTAVLAFEETDRGEFFGVLDACFDQGVNAKVHGEFADAVLTEGITGELLHDVSIEPWDIQDYFVKRLFDVTFAAVGLVVMAPIMAAIAFAIKLDDRGPIFFCQIRTTGFGNAFPTWKFRSMTTATASADPADDQDRVTRIGDFLRKTHLDELPQLWSILVGRMSVVGPRAVWVEEENLIEADVDPDRWRQRWFVKPGLTGLAQIHEKDSMDPEGKLRYDLEYIRRQSLWLDILIVLRQLWMVCMDLVQATVPRIRNQESPHREHRADRNDPTFEDR